jgi:hypothetical protein
MERRKNSRFTCGGEARVTSVGAHPRIEWSALVGDFSRQGISLTVERRFEACTLLIVNWQPKGEAEPQFLVSRVVRVAPKENRMWLLGCTFLRTIAFEDLAVLMVSIRSPRRFSAHISSVKADERLQAKAQKTIAMASRLASQDSMLVAMDGEMLVLRGSATDECSRRLAESVIRPMPGICDVFSAEGQPIRASSVLKRESAFSSLALRPTPVITLANPAPCHSENGVVIPTEETSSASLLHQFVAMHNDMLDQFQQAIVHMVHVFERTHREQMTEIHKELKELREVNRELQELRTQMAAECRPAPDAPVGVPVEATSEDAALEATLAEMEKTAATFSDQERGEGSEDAWFAAAEAYATRTRSGAKQISPRVELKPSSSATEIGSKNATAPNSANIDVSRQSLVSTPAADHNDLFAKLCVRMTTLQEERQSRWRKILGMLNSAGSEH